MLKRFSVMFILTLFVFTTAVFAVNNVSTEGVTKYSPVRFNVFDANNETVSAGYIPGSNFNPISLAPLYARQVYGSETTQRDYQHNTAQGRQIIYGGYYNANCDYVYLDYTYTGTLPGGGTRNQTAFAIYDWAGGDWNFDGGGLAFVGVENSRYVNLSATPDNGWPVIAFHYSADATSPVWSFAGYSSGCPNYTFTNDSLPGPPNTDGIHTGFCQDLSAIDGYIWPKIDVQLNASGRVVTHVASTEADCDGVPDNTLETNSAIYYRKVETTPNEPWTGTWEGPIFIDSVYTISGLVRADQNGPNVYYVYLKPMYYYYGSTNFCTNGLGHYQQSNEVVYRRSTDYGASWESTIYYITDYGSTFEDNGTDPANSDLSAFVDPNGNLHAVWLSQNRDPESACASYYAAKLWHWDSDNNCISLAYDASHPAFWSAAAEIPAWDHSISNTNISWCDDKLYISFERYGAHPEGDTNKEYGAGSVGQDTLYFVADVMVVGSDAVSGSMGQTWTEAINLTNTESDSCLPGECEHESYPTMAMYSTDSLMIEYIRDRDAGAFMAQDEGSMTENPVMFLTWPCFTMAEVGTNLCYALTPSDPTWDEVPLAPNGSTAGCNTPATDEGEIVIQNCGNANLTYTLSSDAGWLTHSAPSTVNAGTGPRGSDDPLWTGAAGCASPSIITWTANSASLSQGNYTGTITVGMSGGAGDFDIVVNAVVTCEYYVPEYATITGGCWTVDVWNTPQAGNQANRQNEANPGNMKFYTCNDTINPLYHEGFVVAWIEGSYKKVYSHAVTQDSTQLHPRALGEITIDSVGVPSSGNGYTHTSGMWCTGDSAVYGIAEYFVPGHSDTSVLIEKITLWNESGVALNDFLLGEEVDWDIDRDSSLDEGGLDLDRNMVYQRGKVRDHNIVAGLAPYGGYDAQVGGRAINGYDHAYSSLGHYPDSLYTLLSGLAGSFEVFSDSSNGTEMRTVHRFWEGTLGTTDTLVICKLKAVSLNDLTGLQALIDKGFAFIENYDLCDIYEPPQCEGECGDANKDTKVNVSDAVFLINYVFSGGDEPRPVKACGDVNNDTKVNVSDAVYLINYVFSGGNPPGLCSPGIFPGGDCCPFEVK